MQSYYCDLCDQIIKGTKHFVIIVPDQIQINNYIHGKYPNKENYELCDNCKKTLIEAFKIRKKKLKEVKEEIEKVFNLPSKDNRRDFNGNK